MSSRHFAVRDFVDRLMQTDDPGCERAIYGEIRAAGLTDEVVALLRRHAEAQFAEADVK